MSIYFTAAYAAAREEVVYVGIRIFFIAYGGHCTRAQKREATSKKEWKAKEAK
jgi:hypothetical protein